MFHAKVPGSLILFGEHSVLHGGTAIICPINQYVTATLIPRSDSYINISSDLLGFYRATIDNFVLDANWKFVLAVVKSYLPKLICGFDLEIISDFSSKLGFGSSAAVTVACVSVFEEWLLKKTPTFLELFHIAFPIMTNVQGMGSGADVAASAFGSVIAYNSTPTLMIKKLDHIPPIVAVYSGNKIPTPEVVAMVESFTAKYPKIISKVYEAMQECALEAICAINTEDWKTLGELMNINQGLLDTLGVSNRILNELIFDLRSSTSIYGAKISGAGLGDCIIGIGSIAANYFPRTEYQVKLGVKQFIIHE